ncbi:MAG: hypothetical protein ACR2PA_07595 [Hyphomicrobiaceae bacterium]
MVTIDAIGLAVQGLQGTMEQLGSTMSTAYAVLAARWRFGDTQRLLKRTLDKPKTAPRIEAQRIPVGVQFNAMTEIVGQAIEQRQQLVDDHCKAHVKLDAAEYAWTQLLDELGTVMPQFAVQSHMQARRLGESKLANTPPSAIDRLAA